MLVKNFQCLQILTKTEHEQLINQKAMIPKDTVILIPELGHLIIAENKPVEYSTLLPITFVSGEDTRITEHENTGEPLWNGNPWPGSGGAGSGVVRWTYTQSSPASTWTLNHNQNKWPISILVFNENEEKIIGMEDWDDSTLNIFIIRFSENIKGKVYLCF
jgi:hypothetical protein